MKTLIIAISIIVIIATVMTVIVGSRIFDGLVEEKPYEAGLAWDDISRNRERLGWMVAVPDNNLRIGKNELVIAVSDKSGKPLASAEVKVTISRPSTRAYDTAYQAVGQGQGRFRILADLPLEGRWDLAADIRNDHEQCRLTRPIFVGKE